jgi:hypothetical protein
VRARNLTPGSEGREPASGYEVEVDGRKLCTFRFETVRLWELDPGALLSLPAPALWTTVALTRGAGEEDVVRACRQVTAEVQGRREQGELLGVLYTLSGTRFDSGWLRKLLPVEVLMEWELESATYNEIVEKGLMRGREEGLEAGRLHTLRRDCLRLVELKLGKVPVAARRRIEALGDAATLEALFDALAAAMDPVAVRSALGLPASRRRAKAATRPKATTSPKSSSRPRARHTRPR